LAAGLPYITKVDDSTYIVECLLVSYNLIFWVDEHKTIILHDHWLAGNGNFRFGRLTDAITNRGCHLIFKVFNLGGFSPFTLNAYKTTFDWLCDYNPLLFTNSILSYQQLSFNAGTIQDCQSNKLRAFTPNHATDCIMKNFIATEYDIGFGTGKGVFENVTGMYGSRPFQTSANTVMRAKDFKAIANTIATVYIGGSNAQITMVNTNVPGNTYIAFTSSTGTYVNELFTYNLTIYINDGVTPLNGATVKIYDVFGTLICDTTTNASGVIAEQELIFRKQTYVGTIRTETLYAPHKLVVSANGYETYTDYKTYTGCVATSHQVGLKPVTRTRYTIEGKPLRALLPENGSSSKLLEL
jgi:hypothetical protein